MEVSDDVPPTPRLRLCARCTRSSCHRCPVSADQERYRQLERTDRRIIRFRMAVAFAIMLILGLQIVETNSILDNQTSARGTLQQLSAVTAELRSSQTAQLKGNATVKQILIEAGQVSAALEQGQTVSEAQITTLLHDVHLLCSATPSCAAQSP